MSGIAGSLRVDQGPAELALVREMADALRHRGADGISHWSCNGVALFQMTLHTTPESMTNELPMCSSDGTLSLVMDGRIDNWEELRKRLTDSGLQLRTRSDAELVLAAYRLWGVRCADYFEGDFAVVLWDKQTRQMFCARDPLGQKPFFYHWDGGRFLFASELRSVLNAMEASPRLNEGVVAEMISNTWLTRDETLWQGIQRLPPGHSMIVDADGPVVTRYWRPDAIQCLRYRSDREYVEHFQDTILDVVKRVSRSHAPVGYDVSGGLDSSSVFATANHLLSAGKLPAPEIHGFTMLFDADTSAYELDYAHAVGEHTGQAITEVPPTLAPLSWYLDETLRRRDIPNLANGLMHEGTYRALRARGGRAYLNGIGGDQLLAFGENALAEALGLRQWSDVGDILRADLSDFGILGAGWGVIRHGAYPLLPETLRAFARSISPVKPEGPGTGTWLSARLQAVLAERRTQAIADWRRKTKGLRIGLRERLMAIEGAYLQFGSELLDSMGQRVGVEVRSPFLNRTFVEFCLSLPLAQLRRGNTDRFLHRTSIACLLPKSVHQRADKAEFSSVSEPLLYELVAVPESQETEWLAKGQLERVQACALEGNQSVHLWPEGMLFFFFLLSALRSGGHPYAASVSKK